MIETPAGRKLEADAEGGEWIVVESSSDVVGAARAATSRMIDFLAAHWGFSPVHAYLLCSVAMNLRFSQVVNEPIFTVSAAISKNILPARKLF
jgi:acetamidase/formamidase